MPDRIRITAVIGNLNKEHGGAQQLLYDVFSRLPGDFEPTVYHLFGPGTYRDDFEEAGVRVRDLRARSNYDIAAFGRLIRRLRADRPDLVLTNSPISGIWGRVAGRIAGIDYIVSVEHSVHHAYRTLPRLANGLTLPLAHAVVGVSQAVVDSLAAWELALLPASTEILSIPNGVDLDRFAPADTEDGTDRESRPIVGSVGRLIEAKGFDRILRAWPAVLEACPEARLEIVGDGPMRDQLGRLTTELGIGASVKLMGYQADPVPAYRRFDLAVLPSRREGFGLAAAEALAVGVPVIAADIPALRSVVGDGGLLVEGPDLEGWARTITDLLDDPGLREALAEAGRERVANRFSADRAARDYAELYRRLVKAR